MGYSNLSDLYAQPAWGRNPRAALDQYMQQQVQLANLGAQRDTRQQQMNLQQYGRQQQVQQEEQRLDWFTERSEKEREQQELMIMQRAKFQYGQGMKGMRHGLEMSQIGEKYGKQQFWGGVALQTARLPVEFASNRMMQDYYRNMMELQKRQLSMYGGQA